MSTYGVVAHYNTSTNDYDSVKSIASGDTSNAGTPVALVASGNSVLLDATFGGGTYFLYGSTYFSELLGPARRDEADAAAALARAAALAAAALALAAADVALAAAAVPRRRRRRRRRFPAAAALALAPSTRR